MPINLCDLEPLEKYDCIITSSGIEVLNVTVKLALNGKRVFMFLNKFEF